MTTTATWWEGIDPLTDPCECGATAYTVVDNEPRCPDHCGLVPLTDPCSVCGGTAYATAANEPRCPNHT